MTQLNNLALNSDRTAADDAARWFLRLQEPTASPQTFVEWQHWMNAAPGHREAYEEIEDTALRLGRVSTMPKLPSPEEMAQDTYDGSAPIVEWRRNPHSSFRPQSSWYRYSIAAGLALVALGGGWFGLQRERVSQLGDYAYETATGKLQVIKLPEGSRVTLDADSALTVKLTASRRSLALKHGEAFFEVAKDPQRPFVVYAGSAQVTAVGTAFNVRMSEDRTVVAVTEGRVEFVAVPKTAAHPLVKTRSATKPQVPGTKARLTAQVGAGESISYVDDGNLQALPAPETPLATAWLEGRRQYRNEPLRYVLADVDRYTGQQFELESEAVGDLLFTGTLNIKNSAAWLRGLSVALPVVVTLKKDGVLSVNQK